MILHLNFTFKTKTNPPLVRSFKQWYEFRKEIPDIEKKIKEISKGILKVENKDVLERNRLFELSHEILLLKKNDFLHDYEKEEGSVVFTCRKCGRIQEDKIQREPLCKKAYADKITEITLLDRMKAGAYLVKHKGRKSYVLVNPQLRKEEKVTSTVIDKIKPRLLSHKLGTEDVLMLR